MQSLQKNVLAMGEERMPYDNIFVWNAYLTQAIRSRCSNTIWTIALVHGHFKQVIKMLLHIFAALDTFYSFSFCRISFTASCNKSSFMSC